MLLGAIEAGSTTAHAFGRDADLVDAAAERLEHVPGTSGCQSAQGRGAAVTREDAVVFAYAATAAAQVGGAFRDE